MKNTKLLTALGMCALLLGACSEEDSPTDETLSTETLSEEEMAEPEEPGLDELDDQIAEEIEKIGTDEEVNWDTIDLNQRQFREFVESLEDDNTDMSEDNEDSPFIVSSTMIDDSTIEIVISNPDTSEMSEFTNGLFALVMDSFTRQLYLHSDFSNGTNQPTIIIQDANGEVISDSAEFIEWEDSEE